MNLHSFSMALLILCIISMESYNMLPFVSDFFQGSTMLLPYTSIWILLYGWIIFHYMHGAPFTYQLVCWWAFGLFQFGVFMNKAAMDIYVSLCGVVGSYYNMVPSIFRNARLLSRVNCTILHSHQQCMKTAISSHPSQSLLFSIFSIIRMCVSVY